MPLPAGLMPCLSSRVESALNESTSVSNALSQLAVPLTMTTFFGVSVISSPKASALCTLGAGAGACAAAGADGVADGAGVALAAGLAAGAGVAGGAGVALAAGAGV